MIKKSLSVICLITSIGFSGGVFAYNAGNTNDSCKKPKFKSFTPQHKSEVPPESDISFTVSRYVNPTTIEAVAKNIPLKLTIENKEAFYFVKATLPAELNGKYARIHLRAKAILGCTGKDGWLLKIKD